MATHAAPTIPVAEHAAAAVTWLVSALWVLVALDCVLAGLLLAHYRQPTLAVLVVLGGILLDSIVTSFIASGKAWS